jgi:hypothetical protein
MVIDENDADRSRLAPGKSGPNRIRSPDRI